MFKRFLLAATLSLVAGSSAAQSTERTWEELGEPAQGHVFYNRPGATVAEHNAELAQCISDTWFGTGREFSMGLAYDLIWGGVSQAIIAVRTENCMLTKGWRAFRLDPAQGGETILLSGTSLTDRVGPWIQAESPPGVLVRTFSNQAANPDAFRTASRPRPSSREHISLKVLSESGMQVAPPAIDLGAIGRQPRARPLRLSQLAEPTQGKAIVLMRLSGGHQDMAFEQDVGDGSVLGLTFGSLPSRDGRWTAFEVPAGRWRIRRIGPLNLCLGSPVFEVASGEVVYAGHFSTRGGEFGPDLDLATARTVLPSPLSEKLRAAEYHNGSTADCNVPYVVFALEIPGAPFEPGYRGGSLAAQP